jgi:hypothetical protein
MPNQNVVAIKSPNFHSLLTISASAAAGTPSDECRY